jgi:hypothetical protein
MSPERARFLLSDPAYDGLVAVADVVSELDVGDAAAAGVLAHPADRDAQEFGDVVSGEKAVALHYRGRLAYVTAGASKAVE